ncbi:SRPBCC family protein [Diaminobutyricibacter sp. McL0618]|uniref:SRPBCC family protein n=1 Tax=Leifsonia sp. McL0618 TaxID=3415677 RepID=UPI003CF5A84C
MTDSILMIQINASPERVYATLADLNGYRDWLSRSRTTAERNQPVGTGASYIDASLIGTAQGVVLQCEPDRLLVFHQAAAPRRSGGSRIAITSRYELMPIDGGTRVLRTGTILTSGLITAAHVMVVAAVKSENRRTLRALKDFLERLPGDVRQIE